MRHGTPAPGLRAFAWDGAAIALLVGAASSVGGDDRWAGRSLHSAVALAQFVGLSPSLLWGASLLAAGLVITAGMLTASPLLRVLGYGAAATWSLFFGLTFVVTVVRDRHAGTTGFVWLPVAALFIILGRRARSLQLTQ